MKTLLLATAIFTLGSFANTNQTEQNDDIPKCYRCIESIGGGYRCERPYNLEPPFQCVGQIIKD